MGDRKKSKETIGLSMENPIVIKAKNNFEGVAKEYFYIAEKHGVRGADWELIRQRIVEDTITGKLYDVLTIKLKNGEVIEYYFDVTEYFGKFF